MIRGTGSPRGTAALKRHFGALVDAVVASEHRFPDGAHFRIEIPSVENPAALRAVVEESRALKVPIHRGWIGGLRSDAWSSARRGFASSAGEIARNQG